MKIYWELYQAFFRIGLLTFGGGYAMLPMLKREVVDNYKWVTEEEMLDIYAIGQCTPGIIAINTATYIGYKKGGFLGGVIATLGEVTPSLLIILLIASILKNFMDYPIVLHAFVGIRIVVCALMMSSVVQMTKSGVKDIMGLILFFVAILLLLFTPITTIMVIIMAAIVGIVVSKIKEGK